MDYRHFICFDFETGSANPRDTQILQIGACAVDRNSLAIKDKFESLMKPDDMDKVEDGALAVNGLSREALSDAPDAAIVFPSFARWIQKHNIRKDKNSFGAPIAMYWNGDGFDMPIFNRYCERFGFWDAKWNNQSLLNPIFTFDVMKHIWFWMRDIGDVSSIKLTSILEYMGISKEEIERGAHDASWDVEHTAKIGIKLLKMSRYLTSANEEGKRRLEMKGCFK